MPQTAEVDGFCGPREPAAGWTTRAGEGEEEVGVEEHLVSLVAPGSFEAEQYRALRHVVEDSRRTRVLTVVAVSSPGDGEGKTTTAINLAGALAQAPDARILLVDADLRRSSVAARLGLDEGGPGLVDVILDPGLALEDVVRSLKGFNLRVLTVGRRTTKPYELLKSPRLGELLEEARQRYDHVVIDTAPVVPISDSRLIAGWVDGFLLVVAARRTRRELLEEALNLLDPAKVVGLVFNGDDRPSSGYYGYYGARGGFPEGPARS
ncbi:MAG: CpsD/CapB family tyrosine-protein kinase [Candidatus Rokubacteria bacterium]|nr:CpsD/CapB family tyrosine-protein kinase [Candidatus Rokubacteria bacterium]